VPPRRSSCDRPALGPDSACAASAPGPRCRRGAASSRHGSATCRDTDAFQPGSGLWGRNRTL